MPFVDVSAPSDSLSIFYRTNLPLDDISLLHTGAIGQKRTLLMLGHHMLSAEFLDNQFNDLELSSNFNLIGLDYPGHGKSECPKFDSKEQLLKVDCWVLGA